MLSFNLLGTVQIWHNNQLINDQLSQKTVGLLCYLLLTGRGQTREFLASLFWPEMTEEIAKKNLRMALSQLRKVLPEYVDIERRLIAFDHTRPYVVDALQLQEQITQLHQLSLAELQQAGELYQGELLAGFYIDSAGFEEWLEAERLAVLQWASQLQQRLLEQANEQQQTAVALTAGRKLLSWRPTDEAVHRQLMRLLALHQEYHLALHQFEQCQTILEQELGVEVMPETQELYERILRARTTPRPPLPADLWPFIGRVAEQKELLPKLNTPQHHLISIIGPGGAGKTRLAVQLAQQLTHHFLEGVYFIPLVKVTDGRHLMRVIADSVGCFLRQTAGEEQLLKFLQDRELLLVLDGFEHLIPEGKSLLQAILRHAPQAKLLLTSRFRLHVEGEWVFPLTGLSYPSHIAADPAESYEALQLFEQVARRSLPSFDPTTEDQQAIGRICQLVEGLPLGIELAASWVRALPCPDIQQELENSASLLDMQAVFDYSLRLLPPAEREIFTQLTIFQGGFDLKAARAITPATPFVLSSLVDKSLLRLESDRRYYIHELLRQYVGQGRNPAGELTHARYYLSLATSLLPKLQGHQQREGLETLRVEQANLRLAWSQAITAGLWGEIELALPAVYTSHILRGHYRDLTLLFEQALAHMNPEKLATPAEQHVFYFLSAATAQVYVELENTSKARELAYQVMGFVPQLPPHELLAYTLVMVGRALPTLNEALYQHSQEMFAQHQNRWGQAWAVYHLAKHLEWSGQYEAAAPAYEQAVALFRVLGEQRWLSHALIALGNIALAQHQVGRAQELHQAGLETAQKFGDSWTKIDCLSGLAKSAVTVGEYGLAQSYYEEILALLRQTGDQERLADMLNALGYVFHLAARPGEARHCYQQSLAIGKRIGDEKAVAWALQNLGDLEFAAGRWGSAKTLYQESLAIFEAQGLGYGAIVSWKKWGSASLEMGELPAAEKAYQQALKRAQQEDLVPEIPELLVHFAVLRHCQHKNEAAAQLLQLALHHPKIPYAVQERAEGFLAQLNPAGAVLPDLEQVMDELLR